MDSEKVGKFIYQLRVKNNLTQNELATKINVTNKAVSRWERGIGFPDISLLEPLSKVLNISILELLNGEYIKEKSQAEKKDINVLLQTLLKTNEKNKYNKTLIISIIILFTSVIISIVYFNFRFYGLDNSYIFKLFNNISLIPFSNIYSAIINKSIISCLQNILVNTAISFFINIGLLFYIKNSKNFFKLTLIINVILEIIKWLFLLGIFDINDILIRITIGVLIVFITKSLKKFPNLSKFSIYN